MAPIIEVSDENLKSFNQLGISYKLRNDLENSAKQSDNQDNLKENFVYVPSLKLYISKERSHLGKNWFDSHKELQKNNERMLIIPEFIDFLKYLKSSNSKEHKNIYNEIIKVRNLWRAEWLDADFKVKDNKLYVNYSHFLDSEDNLTPKYSKVFDKSTLMNDKTPGISLDDWLNFSHTKQGLPKKSIKEGNLYYWHPRSDNNSVAGFGVGSDGADLYCYRYPASSDSSLGVRAVRRE
mgnify:FL=1